MSNLQNDDVDVATKTKKGKSMKTVEEYEAIIEKLERKIDKQGFTINRLRKGGKFCKTCHGSGFRMNRNGYSEDCFSCDGTGVII